jgi:uncharacterized membrane protein YkoI
MHTRTMRMFSAMIVAICLMFVGDVIWNISASTAGVNPTSTYAISFDQARIIAQDTAPYEVVASAPTLTTYAGSVAYAVPMEARTIYVEAMTGRVLSNTKVAATSGAQQE